MEFLVLDTRRDGDASPANIATLLAEGYEIVPPDGLLIWRKRQPKLSLQRQPEPPAEAPEQPA